MGNIPSISSSYPRRSTMHAIKFEQSSEPFSVRSSLPPHMPLDC